MESNNIGSRENSFINKPGLISYIGLINDDLDWEIKITKTLGNLGLSPLAGPTLPDGRDIILLRFRDVTYLTSKELNEIFCPTRSDTCVFECIVDCDDPEVHYDSVLGLNEYIPTWGRILVPPTLSVNGVEGNIIVKAGDLDPGVRMMLINDGEDRAWKLDMSRDNDIELPVGSLCYLLHKLSKSEQLNTMLPDMSISLPRAGLRGLLPEPLKSVVQDVFDGKELTYRQTIHSKYGN